MSTQVIGGILALLGAGILLDAVLPFPLPLFKIALGLVLLYFSVRLIAGERRFRNRDGASTILSEASDTPTDDAILEYSTIMGRHLLDLSHLNAPARVEVQVSLGEQIVRVPRDLPVHVRAQAVFAAVRLPDGVRPGLGTSVYGVSTLEPVVEIMVTAMFSSVIVETV